MCDTAFLTQRRIWLLFVDIIKFCFSIGRKKTLILWVAVEGLSLVIATVLLTLFGKVSISSISFLPIFLKGAHSPPGCTTGQGSFKLIGKPVILNLLKRAVKNLQVTFLPEAFSNQN